MFLGTPESRPTAQPPEDYYIYFIPPFSNEAYTDEKKKDEVFFVFKQNEEFKNDLKLYATALMMRDLAEEKNKGAYQTKADRYKKQLMKYLSENKNTCFEVIYGGEKKQLLEVMKGQYKASNPFKETMDLVSSICFDNYFNELYPEFPIYKTVITLRNQADTIRAGFDRYAGRKNQQANALLESYGLLDGENITVKNSKYAQHFIKELDKLPAKAVINFSDIYSESFDGYYDKRFKISYAHLPVVLLALVHTGHAVIALGNGTTLTASNLDIIPKTSVVDLYEFKYFSKPKDVQLAELVRLFEVLELPVGLINNPAQRENGIEQLLKKAQDMAAIAVRAGSKLNGEFVLWGEPLIAMHIANEYKNACSRVVDMFGNFSARFNTVAKLNNFTYTMDEINQIQKDIEVANTVMEFEKFKTECLSNVSYMMNLERMNLGAAFLSELEAAKESFRKIRDDISEEMNGEASASDVNLTLEKVKSAYIDLYFAEHQKKRLGVNDAKRKGEIVSSAMLANLKKLKAIEILSSAKLEAIESNLTSLIVCYDLTVEDLKASPICKNASCRFSLDSNETAIKGKLDEIEDRVDSLLNEWTETLLNTISDPLVLAQESFLSKEQRNTIKSFVADKKLPDKIDQFFINAVQALLKGFEPVSISASEFIDKLDAIGPCDVNTFKTKLNEIVTSYITGKDNDKLRIVVKR